MLEESSQTTVKTDPSKALSYQIAGDQPDKASLSVKLPVLTSEQLSAWSRIMSSAESPKCRMVLTVREHSLYMDDGEWVPQANNHYGLFHLKVVLCRRVKGTAKAVLAQWDQREAPKSLTQISQDQSLLFLFNIFGNLPKTRRLSRRGLQWYYCPLHMPWREQRPGHSTQAALPTSPLQTAWYGGLLVHSHSNANLILTAKLHKPLQFLECKQVSLPSEAGRCSAD